MKNEIYIKRFIKTEDDLPKKEGAYHVCDNFKLHDTYLMMRTLKDDDFWFKEIHWYLQPTTLAELIKEKLPSEKEIEGEAMTYSSYPAMPDGHPEFDPSQANDFDAGAKYVINKLTE